MIVNQPHYDEWSAKGYGTVSPKFGDRVENAWASERNPHRIAIFVRKVRRQQQTCLQMTDGKGNFWKTFNNEGSLNKILEPDTQEGE